MDKSTACAMAMNAIGKTSYASGTPGGEACDLYFGQIYTELLARHDWSFARRRVTLKKNDDGAYRVPPDCLRIVELTGLRNWRIYNEHICPEEGAVPEGDVVIVYTSSQLADMGLVPNRVPMFARVLVLRLAAALAAAVSHDDKKSEYFLSMAHRELLEAMTLDTQQDNSNDQHPLNMMISNSVTREI